jgi:hypothetical protein
MYIPRFVVWIVFVGTVALLRRATNRRMNPPPGPRLREGPQVVGFPCAKCGERIIFDREAGPCATCGQPLHLACMPHAHDDGSGTPYRS